MKIEICCGSADDVIRAEQAGADRAELNSALFAGGLTPSIGAVQEAKKQTSIPIICMLRPRAGGFCYTEHEFQSLLFDLQALRLAGADGFAVGCLTQEGELDKAKLKKLMDAADGKEMVFHRAFDCMVSDPIQTVRELADLGFQRLLTSGRKSTAWEGRELICKMQALKAVEILPGSGLRKTDLTAFLNFTKCDQIHLTFHVFQTDTSIRNPEISFSGSTPPDNHYDIVDKEGLSAFIKQLR